MKNVEIEKALLTIEYDRVNIFKILFLAKDIDGLIKKEQDIPSKLLLKFLGYFAEHDPLKRFKDHLDEMIEGCYKYLKDCDYDFSINRIVVKKVGDYRLDTGDEDRRPVRTQRLKVEYNLRQLITDCFDALINLDIHKFQRTSKNNIVRFIYSTVLEKTKDIDKRDFTTFKKYVLTGLIASHLGIIATKKTYFEIHHTKYKYNKFLFDQVRNKLTPQQAS
jgi:hypothetical protein